MSIRQKETLNEYKFKNIDHLYTFHTVLIKDNNEIEEIKVRITPANKIFHLVMSILTQKIYRGKQISQYVKL